MTRALHLFEKLMPWASQFGIRFKLVPSFGCAVLDRLKIARWRGGPGRALAFRDHWGASARSSKRARWNWMAVCSKDGS